ncbi:mCG117059, partial [Mus musculus]
GSEKTGPFNEMPCSGDVYALGVRRKQAQQATRTKPVSSTSPWPLHQLLPPGSCPTLFEFLS